MYDSDIEIRPKHGWANIELGNSLAEVRAALATNGHPYDLSSDEFTLDIHSPETTFYFNDSTPKQLVQIVFYDQGHRVDGAPVIGLPLDEAMLPFNVKAFEDTLWSTVSIEEEYQKGRPLHDSKRNRQATSKQKLEHATLWIKSQGVGLVMLFGVVHALAIRRQGNEPKVGCGILDASTMGAAGKPQPSPKANPRVAQSNINAPRSQSQNWRLRSLFALLTILFLAIPIGVVYRDLSAWRQAIAVVGVVVETKPEGPSPDEIVVKYQVPNVGEFRVAIPDSYTTARDVGTEVELIYVPTRPERAMTQIQARDDIWSISPYYLFGSVGLSMFFLHLTFPNHIRQNSRHR
jgi:hypothetical protein